MTSGLIIDIVKEVKLLMLPIISASKNENILRNKVLAYLGLPFNAIEDISEIKESFENIIHSIENLHKVRKIEIKTLSDAKQFIELIEKIIKNLKLLKEVTSLRQAFSSNSLDINSGIEQLFDSLVFEYLFYWRPSTFNLFALLEIIPNISEWKEVKVKTEFGEEIIHLVNFRFNKVLIFLSNPIQYLKLLYFPNGISTDEDASKIAQKLFPRLGGLLNSFGFSTFFGKNSKRLGVDFGEKNIVLENSFIIYKEIGENNFLGITIALSKEEGIVIVPLGGISHKWYNENWLIFANLYGELNGFSNNLDEVGDFHFHLVSSKLENPKTENLDTPVLIAGSVVFDIFCTYWNQKWDFGLFFNFKDVGIEINKPESNGFLKKVFPSSKFEWKSDIMIGWTLQKGLHFRGSSGLELDLYQSDNNKNGFKVDKLSLKAAILSEEKKITTQFGAYFKIKTTALTFSLEHVGAEISIGFSDKYDKQLGPIDFEISPLLPSGIALSLDKEKFKGGGFLSRKDKRYTGTLQLNFNNKINLTAIGILDTELPDSQDGYALLVMILGDGFQPIELSMGFKLIGIGGLLAWNRSMSLPNLKKGIKEDSLDKILFPSNPLENYSTIIKNLDTAFPIAENQFVFGPMAQIQWGSPKPILQIELGLFIEVSSPVRIGIPGVLKTILPSEDSKILSIKVNFLGSIDFEKKMIAFDATIFESKIMNFTLSGDIAFRLKWGENPLFLLSAGGFHPKAPTPPVPIDRLDRLRINLVNKKNAKVNLEAYFAITSNTVQVGAKLDAKFKALHYWAIGKVQFDLLFQFNPFRFYFDVSLAASVQNAKGEEKLAIYVDVSIEGPAPWYVVGKAVFKIIFEIPINVELTFGGKREDATLPNINILPLLEEALKNPVNWSRNSLPFEIDLIKVNVPTNTESLILTPQSGLKVQQEVVPMDVVVQRFGNAKPLGQNEFRIEKVLIGEEEILIDNFFYTESYFARSNFFNLSDEEKLTTPSFELFSNGIELNIESLGGIIFGTEQKLEKIEYEEILIDKESRRRKIEINYAEFEHFIIGATPSTSIWSQARSLRKNSRSSAKKIIIKRKKPAFQIVKKKDLSIVESTSLKTTSHSRENLRVLLKQEEKLAHKYQVIAAYDRVKVRIPKKSKQKPSTKGIQKTIKKKRQQ